MKIFKLRDIKKGLITLAVSFVIFSGLIGIMFVIQSDQIKDRTLLELRSDLRTYSNEIDNKIAEVATDLMLIEDLFVMQSDISFIGGNIVFNSNDNREEIEEALIAWVTNKNVYDQIRVLDLNGNELVRVNYNFGEPMAVDEENLQNKSSRYYFENSIILDDDSIYLSEIDLNIENGEIEFIDGKPKEMLRVASPLFVDDVKIGLVIINYLSTDLFTPEDNQSVYSFEVINDDGYFLYSENTDIEYGFMFDDKLDETFSKYYEYDIFSKSNGIINQEIYDGSTYTSLIISESYLTTRISSSTDKDIEIVSENTKIMIFEELDLRKLDEYKALISLVITLGFVGLIISYIVSLLVSEISYQRKERLITLEYSATHDALTGLYNRTKIFSLIGASIKNNKKFTVLFMDLDGFKLVNDSLGHEAGDEILVETAKRLKHAVNQQDTVSRLGGDEFMVLLDGKNTISDVNAMIDHIKQEIRNDFFYKKNKVNIGVSVGYSIYEKEKTVDEMVFESDKLMYEDKRNSKYPD